MPTMCASCNEDLFMMTMTMIRVIKIMIIDDYDDSDHDGVSLNTFKKLLIDNLSLMINLALCVFYDLNFFLQSLNF